MPGAKWSRLPLSAMGCMKEGRRPPQNLGLLEKSKERIETMTEHHRAGRRKSPFQSAHGGAEVWSAKSNP